MSLNDIQTYIIIDNVRSNEMDTLTIHKDHENWIIITKYQIYDPETGRQKTKYQADKWTKTENTDWQLKTSKHGNSRSILAKIWKESKELNHV